MWESHMCLHAWVYVYLVCGVYACNRYGCVCVSTFTRDMRETALRSCHFEGRRQPCKDRGYQAQSLGVEKCNMNKGYNVGNVASA